MPTPLADKTVNRTIVFGNAPSRMLVGARVCPMMTSASGHTVGTNNKTSAFLFSLVVIGCLLGGTVHCKRYRDDPFPLGIN